MVIHIVSIQGNEREVCIREFAKEMFFNPTYPF